MAFEVMVSEMIEHLACTNGANSGCTLCNQNLRIPCYETKYIGVLEDIGVVYSAARGAVQRRRIRSDHLSARVRGWWGERLLC
jgi:hypothetical protein